MTADLSIDVTVGQVRGIPVPVTSADQVLLTGPGRLYGWSLREASGDISQAVEGSAAAPAAGATIATLTVAQAGIYTVAWSVELAGAVAAADANNFGLYQNGILRLQSLNPAVVGAYPQPGIQLTVAAGDVIAIKAIGAATAGTTYSASESVIPANTVNAVVELQDGGQPLAEIGIPVGGTENRWMGPVGVNISNQVKLHLVSGTVVGVVYAGFERYDG